MGLRKYMQTFGRSHPNEIIAKLHRHFFQVFDMASGPIERDSLELERDQKDQEAVVTEAMVAKDMIKGFGRGNSEIEKAAAKEREKQEKKAAKRSEREAKKAAKQEAEDLAKGVLTGKKLSKKERKSLENM